MILAFLKTFIVILLLNIDAILRDFRNAQFYIHCLFHMFDLRMFSLSFYPLAQWTMICHDFDLRLKAMTSCRRNERCQRPKTSRFDFVFPFAFQNEHRLETFFVNYGRYWYSVTFLI